MGKYMFADPLDLIMIYGRNICSNVPHLPLCPLRLSVLYLINLSELEMARPLTETSELAGGRN